MSTHITAPASTVTTSEVLGLATEIVASYVSNNTLNSEELSPLVQKVYKTLTELASGRSIQVGRPDPVVPIKKSISDDYIVCLEDGKKLKMLKRHLKTAYNMSPDEYRERWGLGPDYPMVAPNYARQRSTLAKNIGLGTRARNKNASATAVAA